MGIARAHHSLRLLRRPDLAGHLATRVNQKSACIRQRSIGQEAGDRRRCSAQAAGSDTLTGTSEADRVVVKSFA